MKYQRTGDAIIIRIDRGELVMERLMEVLRAEGITKGALTALGAVDMAELGYLDGELHEVLFKTFEREMEIAAMVGNITQMDGKPYVHAHVALSNADYTMTGGHLKEARCSATVEIVVTVIEGGDAIDRKFSPEVGIALMDF